MPQSPARGRPRPAPGTARAAAREMMRGALLSGRTIAESAPEAEAALPPEGRAAARRLAAEGLRHLARADAALKPHLRAAPPPAARIVLRLAATELMTGGAPHGVVGEAVSAVRALPGGAPLAGMTNAVLRRVAEGGRAAWEDASPNRLPNWIRGRVQGAVGAARTAAIEAAHDRGAPLDITPRDGDAAALAARFGGEALPTGSVRLPAGAQVSALPGFEAGEWWVQDAAAALPARMLGVREGERALDLCAAPGGKAMQLAAAGAEVTAVDASAARLGRLRENLARTGLRAEIVAADLLEWAPPAPVPAILLDAPCSATGTIRRHPDLPFARDGGALKALAARQGAMLERALGWLAPGGRLVYCTCSLLPEEGERVVAAALERDPKLGVERWVPEGVPADWHGTLGLRTAPDRWAERGGMDGFFMARLVRDG